ncbi:MAG: hypothetical protein QOD70_1435 [Frankiales bacterium]|nr:hypothetical protein [Frankiales bacterium]
MTSTYLQVRSLPSKSVGSGLILFAIVIAWLIVLVPMALRSHDNSTYAKSADRFSQAMRVLSRRSGRDVLVPRRPYSSLVVSETKSARPARIPEERVAVDEPLPEPEPLSPAQRRSRTLAVLTGLALVTLGLTLAGLRIAVFAQVMCDLLVVAFVVHCRRQAILRAQRRASRPRARAVAPAPVRNNHPRAAAARIAGIPDRMPMRPAPLAVPLPAPAARYEDVPSPAAATGTDSWDPVPVPPPTYVSKPVAPRREPRVLDLTKPGAWTAALEGDDLGLEILDDELELDDILERRRAAGDW